MKILLIAATEFEITPFLNFRNSDDVLKKNIDILITGVGIPSTIYHLTKKIFSEKYDMIIQAGIAGSFSKKIKKGEVVFVKQDAFGDIGIEEKGEFKTLFDFGFADKNEFPFENEWLVNNYDTSNITKAKYVKAVTINKISNRKKQKKQLKKIFDANVESMEGAAFHYVCLQQQISFLQLRSISNYVGVRDKAKWKMKEAIENLNIELTKLINELSK